MIANCKQCSEEIDKADDIQECVVCMDNFCVSCMNGQWNCEACTDVENADNEEFEEIKNA